MQKSSHFVIDTEWMTTGTGHGTMAVLLPGFAINWWQKPGNKTVAVSWPDPNFTWHGGHILQTYINGLMPKQNDCHFTDDTFKCIFLNEYVRIAIEFSMNLCLVVKLTIFSIGTNDVRLSTHICVTRPQWVNDNNESGGCCWLVCVVVVVGGGGGGGGGDGGGGDYKSIRLFPDRFSLVVMVVNFIPNSQIHELKFN